MGFETMDTLRERVLALTGKYDKLVQDVKTLKTKIKKDETTINALQTEVNALKKGKPTYQQSSLPMTTNTNSFSTATEPQSAPTKQDNLDPLDMFFGNGDVSSSNAGNATKSNDNLLNDAKASDQDANGFGTWTT